MITPSRLQAARQVREWTPTELSHRTGIPADTIRDYERGTAPGTELHVHQLASVLRVTPAFFSRPALRPPAPEAISFRQPSRIPGKMQDRLRWSAALMMEWYAAAHKRGRLSPKPANLPRVEGLTPEATALAIRKHLTFQDGPIGNVVKIAEHMRIWASYLPEDIDVAAHSYWLDGRPHIVLSHLRDPCESRIDVAREMYHLLAHPVRDADPRQQDRDADLFARAFLVPDTAWYDEAPPVGDPCALLQQKGRWGVPVLTLIERSRELGIIDDHTYRNSLLYYSKRGFCREEPNVRGRAHESPLLLRETISRLVRKNTNVETVCGEIGWGTDLAVKVFGSRILPKQGHGLSLEDKKRPSRPAGRCEGQVLRPTFGTNQPGQR